MVNFCRYIVIRNIDIVIGILLGILGIIKVDNQGLKLYGSLGNRLLYSLGLKYLVCEPGDCVGCGHVWQVPISPARVAGDICRRGRPGSSPLERPGNIPQTGGIPLERVKIDYNTLLSFTKGITYGKL